MTRNKLYKSDEKKGVLQIKELINKYTHHFSIINRVIFFFIIIIYLY